MTKEETIQMLESIERRCKDFPYMTAQDWVTIAAAKRHLNEDIYNERTKEAIEPTSDEIGNYDHEKVTGALLPELKENTDSHEALEGLLLAFALTFETKGKTLGECLEEFKPKIIDAAKKINTSTSEDLNEAADFYSSLFSDIAAPYIRNDAFIAGAQWQEEQFEKERLKHCDALTEEQAQIESDFVIQHLKKNNRTPTFIDAIEYGMALQEEKDNICYEEIIEEGAKWKYDEMMKNAITAKVHNLNLVIDSCDIARHIESCKNGDKVKILVIKEGEQ